MRCLIILLLTSCIAYGQQDSVDKKKYELPEVTISHKRAVDLSTGQRIVFADSSGLENKLSYSLAEQLSFGNTSFIRAYGLNGLTTLSLQGSSDVHSAIVWNGFNLQSVMNGTFDISLFPVFFSDEVGVLTGSSTGLWGSGAAGGSIILNNKPHFGQGLGLKTNTEAGSYGQFRQQLKASYGTRKWYGSVKAYFSEARNDYPVSQRNDPAHTLTHAATEQKGVLGENYLRWKNSGLAIRFWLQDNYRENPRTELNGTIYHRFRRGNAEYHKEFKKINFNSRAAWLREEIFYKDPVRTEHTTSLADALIIENEFRLTLAPRHLINSGINLTHQQASVVNTNFSSIAYLINPNPDKYNQGRPERQLMAMFVQYKYKSVSEKFSGQLSFRQELVKGIKIPPVPALGLEYLFQKWLLLKGNVTGLYRIPTFNELYWIPGGNIQLEPEQGWNSEASLRATKEYKKLSAFYELAVFKRQINNWIRWVPDGSFWSAKNIAIVNSEGIENKAGILSKTTRGNFKLQGTWSYVYSRTDKSLLANDKSLGLQVIFIPMYQGNVHAVYNYKKFYLEYNHTYTGYVYTSSDHAQWLKPFHVGNIIASQTIPFKKMAVSLVFRINNAWNSNYRTVIAYPMPPRNFSAGIMINFNQ